MWRRRKLRSNGSALRPRNHLHDVGGFFAPIEAVLVERAEHSVFFVAGVEESAHMILPGEIASCYFH
jgi:hypothetical protein